MGTVTLLSEKAPDLFKCEKESKGFVFISVREDGDLEFLLNVGNLNSVEGLHLIGKLEVTKHYLLNLRRGIEDG